MNAFWSRTLAILALAAALAFATGTADARTGSHYYGSRSHSHSTHYSGHRYHLSGSHRSSSHHYSSSGHHTSRYAQGVERDSHGRIKRSESARRAFERETGYPHGRPGYVVDHIVPLSKGGADDPSNMQWQTTQEAKAKDKTERK